VSRKEEITEQVIEDLELDMKLTNAVKFWWWPDYNYCENLRLTKPGLTFVQKVVTPYSFEFDFLNTGNMLKQLAKLDTPFYVDREGIVLFSPQLATMVKMYPSFDRYLELINQ